MGLARCHSGKIKPSRARSRFSWAQLCSAQQAENGPGLSSAHLIYYFTSVDSPGRKWETPESETHQKNSNVIYMHVKCKYRNILKKPCDLTWIKANKLPLEYE